jgi:hypothetical protein
LAVLIELGVLFGAQNAFCRSAIIPTRTLPTEKYLTREHKHLPQEIKKSEAEKARVPVGRLMQLNVICLA